MKEIWKEIPEYENLYAVSNLGRVKSLRFNPPKDIYQTTTNCGYKQVKLYKFGKAKQIGVHRLVAMMFVDGYDENLEVNHIDLNKENNAYTNLEWVTRAYNQKHQYLAYHQDHSTKVNRCRICGKEISKGATYCLKHREDSNKKQKRPKIEDLKEDLRYLSFVKIGKKYGYSDNGIRKICKEYGLPITRNEVDEYRRKH